MRKFVNDTALDILYYTTPLYRNDIVSGLRKELNRVFALFKANNPDFDGKVFTAVREELMFQIFLDN